MEPWWWWHSMGFMWIFPLIFLIICIAFMSLFMSRGHSWFFRRHGGPETAREILDRRFASGEITKDQYEDMKRVIGG